MLYYIEVSGTPLWVATMPHGTTDRAFADRVAASIAGARVVEANPFEAAMRAPGSFACDVKEG